MLYHVHFWQYKCWFNSDSHNRSYNTTTLFKNHGNVTYDCNLSLPRCFVALGYAVTLCQQVYCRHARLLTEPGSYVL